MKKYLIISGAALVLCAACNKEEAVVETPNTPAETLVTFGIEQPDSPTKTDLYGTYSVNWAEGDIILLNCDGVYEPFTLREGAGTRTGVFGNSEGKVYKNEIDTYSTSAWYPETTNPGWKASDQGTGWHITIPAEYAWSEQGLKAPMMAYLSTEHPTWQAFSVLSGVIKVDINGIPANANKLVFTAPGKQVSGEFMFTEESSVRKIKTFDSATNNTVTITFPAGTETFRSFCIPVPEGTYANYTLQFYEDDTPIAGTGRRSSLTIGAKEIAYVKPYSCDSTPAERVIWQGPKFLGDSWDYNISDLSAAWMTALDIKEGQTITFHCTASSYADAESPEWTYRAITVCKLSPWEALTDGNKSLTIGCNAGVKYTKSFTLTANDVTDIKAGGMAITGTRTIIDKITLQ